MSWLECMHAQENSLHTVIDSDPIKLTGGSKYKVKVMYYHSSHNQYQKKSNPFITLRWSSDKFLAATVPTENLYYNNIPTPL